MKKISILIACLVFFAAMPLLAADDQVHEEKKPAGNSPQKELFENKCQKCHALERVRQAHLTRDRAKEVVERMRKKPGADISKADAESIYRYLGDYFLIPPSQPAAPVPIN